MIKFTSKMTMEILYWHIHHGRIVLQGAASPQAVKKLLSLSEQSRPKVEHSHHLHHHHQHSHHHHHHLIGSAIGQLSPGGRERTRVGLLPGWPPTPESSLSLPRENFCRGARSCFTGNTCHLDPFPRSHIFELCLGAFRFFVLR